jgi:hypothetical protein
MRFPLFPTATGLVLLSITLVHLYAGYAKRGIDVPDRPPLATAIPAAIAGWTVTDLDLGPTESVTERSHNLLKLDDFVHRNYVGPAGSFSVYVAYWQPGKMPVRLVNQHSPDRCWTEVGWACIDRRWDVEKMAGDIPLQPAQWGAYQIYDYVNQTYFWHIVGGRTHWYGGQRLNTRSSVMSILQDLRTFGFNTYREQYFVRVVSQQSLDDLWTVPAFQQVMADLAALCLAQPDAMATAAVLP